MKICDQCKTSNPDDATYCMHCGIYLDQEIPGKPETGGNWILFWLTLVGSLVLSWLLIAVFHLPVFILGAILPLFWISKGKRR